MVIYIISVFLLSFATIGLTLFLRERKCRKDLKKELELSLAIEKARKSRCNREEEKRRRFGCGDMGFIEGDPIIDDQD